MTKFSKSEMKKAGQTLRKTIGKGYPKTIKMTDMNNKTHNIDKAHYMGLFEAQNIYIRNHGKYPNYVTLNTTANNPLVMDYQDNGYTCGPTSLSMATQMCFDYISEQKCAKACKTVIGSGTTPANLITGAKSLGYQLTRIGRNYSSVKKALQAGMPVIAQIQTKPATCLGFVNDYGHYILIYAVTSDGYYKVADPTKGLKKCKPSILDKATNGRDIGYYSVKPV